MRGGRSKGVVDFENINEIKKKSVRGLLKKRARKYDSDNSESDEGQYKHTPKKVQKATLSDAFKSIMSKNIKESIPEPILSGYRKPARLV